jgi:hypothetical protein
LSQLTLPLGKWAQGVTQPATANGAVPTKPGVLPAVAERVIGGALTEAHLVAQTAAMVLSDGI